MGWAHNAWETPGNQEAVPIASGLPIGCVQRPTGRKSKLENGSPPPSTRSAGNSMTLLPGFSRHYDHGRHLALAFTICPRREFEVSVGLPAPPAHVPKRETTPCRIQKYPRSSLRPPQSETGGIDTKQRPIIGNSAISGPPGGGPEHPNTRRRTAFGRSGSIHDRILDEDVPRHRPHQRGRSQAGRGHHHQFPGAA